MASSRTRPPKADPDTLLLAAVRSAVATARDEMQHAQQMLAEPLRRTPRRRTDEPVVLALSGGRDSMALLDLCARLARQRGSALRALHAVHVHHGLRPDADRWATHCEQQCAQRNVPLSVRRVQVRPAGRGIEAAAREARYAALAQAAAELGARIVMTAHHRDDRIETFVLQWLRGAGIEGLAAFPPHRTFGERLLLVRPLIEVARSEIESYIDRQAIAFVDDDSNDDRTLLRNAVRADILPRLEALRPGFHSAAARSIDLVAEAAETLRSVARSDLLSASEGAPEGMLWIDRLLSLPAPRAAGALRSWLAAAGLQAPSRARLSELMQQLRSPRSDARLLVRIGNVEVRRYRGLLLMKPPVHEEGQAHAFRWDGDASVFLPGWGGALRFITTDDDGFEPQWLREAVLEVRPRGGGERFKPAANRPSKTLKRLFQDAGVPEFERGRLPLLWRGNDLIFVAGLGSDVRFTSRNGSRIQIAWQPDPRLLDGH